MRKLSYLAALLLPFTAGIVSAYAVLTAVPESKGWAGVVFDARLMSGEQPLEVASLGEMVGAAGDDAEAGAAIRAYYEANAGRLAEEFDEANDARLRGLFGMYITHVAVAYGVVETEPGTLLEFIAAPTAHCGVYAKAQSQVYDALGLVWRTVVVDGGWHGLNEVLIDGRYETFDATSNVWLSVSVEALLNGAPREYRTFYTPIFDAQADEAYRAHLATGHNVPELRAGLPLWGLRVFPSTWMVVDRSES